MRIIGGIFILVLSLVVSTNQGFVGFIEAWAIIGIFAFVGSMICLFLSLPRMAVVAGRDLDEDPSADEAESFMKRHVSLYSYGGFLVFGSIGALLASVVI